MATALTTITNISKQNVPILVGSISNALASADSEIGASAASQLTLPAGTQVTVEKSRTDAAQLEQLRRKGLITYT